MLFGESVAQSCTILLFLSHAKSVVWPMQVFTTIKKSLVQFICSASAQIMAIIKSIYEQCYYYYYYYFKFLQVFRTLLSILVDLNIAVVSLVWILPLISKSFRLLSKSLGSVPSTLTKISLPVTFILLFWEFFTPIWADGLLESECDSKSPQVFWTLLSILAYLNNAVVWLVSAHLLIYNSSCPLSKPLGIVPSPLITVGITVTCIFPTFLFL